MRVIFLRSNQVNPDPRVEKEVEAISEFGYFATILAWNRNEPFLPNEEVISFNGKNYIIIRKYIPATFGGGLRNLFPLFMWQIFLFYWLFKNNRIYDIIHACDFDTIIPAILIKFLFKKKVIYDIFDYYIDSFNVPKPLMLLIKTLDRIAMKLCDRIIVCDELRLEQINVPNNKKYEIIYNTPKDLLPSLSKISSLNSKENKKLILSYVGILQPNRFILEMLEIFKKHPEWELYIGGFGTLEAIVKDVHEKYRNIYFLGRLSYFEALKVYFKSDIIFAIYNPKIKNHRFSSPNKVFEAMMLKKPIIVAKGTGIDVIVEKYKFGISVNYENTEEVENTLKELENPIYREELGKNGRKLYEEKYSWEISKKRLIEMYNEVKLTIEDSSHSR